MAEVGSACFTYSPVISNSSPPNLRAQRSPWGPGVGVGCFELLSPLPPPALHMAALHTQVSGKV